jgi:hypothetical protein
MNSNDKYSTAKEEHIAKSLGSKSFFNLTTLILKNIQLTAQYPSYLDYEETINYYPDKKSGFMKGCEIKDSQGIICTDQDIVKRQSGVFADLAKQLAKGIFKSGTVSVSLPIRIFEPRGMLERYSDWFCFAPILLKKGGASDDKIEAFKYAISYGLSALFFSSGQLKPFNPFLGETWEGQFEDGTKIYFEHTSHLPCQSNYLIDDSEGLYRSYGYYDISLEGALKIVFNNYVYCVQKGKSNICFKGTKQTISYQQPKVLLGGMILGNRYCLYDGFMKFEDRQNNMKAYIFFNKGHSNLKNRRFHDIYGQIFYHDFSKDKKKEEFYESKTPKNPFPSDKSKIISEITGSYLEQIVFDNTIYWTIADSYPPQIYPVEKSCPSDTRHREDFIWLKRANLYSDYKELYQDYSQKWKIALEVQHRHDRSLREKKKKK